MHSGVKVSQRRKNEEKNVMNKFMAYDGIGKRKHFSRFQRVNTRDETSWDGPVLLLSF